MFGVSSEMRREARELVARARSCEQMAPSMLECPTYTDANLLDDINGVLGEQATKALARIEETNGFRIHPASLADELNVSRRWLERRFKETLGKGVAQLIRETMLNHVRRLVQETDIPFQKLAADAGIATSAHLSVLFRRHFGTTMSATRRGHVGRSNQL